MPPAPTSLDPRTPVIVAVGQVDQRVSDPTDALEPTALLAEAARAAGRDSGSDRLLGSVDTVAVPQILSHAYRDAAAVVAAELGIEPARTIVTDNGGNYPQTLLNRACTEISAGTSQAWLIGGAEAWRSRQKAQAEGIDLGWTPTTEGSEPTEFLANGRDLSHPGEWARGLVLPATVYALFENALRAARGWTIDEHRDQLAHLWAGFSAVAVDNPHAWIREPWTAAEIRDPSPANRMIGFPYTKVMNSNNAVEQAACFVVTSVEVARSLGSSSDRWVFPWAGADAHEHWFVSNRWSLAEAPSVRIAGEAALELAGAGVDDLAHIDIYSCFPSAVQIAAAELGIGTDRPLTVTGGLSFAGGPWSNYVSHSIATMVERLRADPGALGMVTANGGYLTKHAITVYSAAPPPSPWRHANPQDEVDRLPQRALGEVVDEAATVEAAVVVHDRTGQPDRAMVSALLADGRRAWGATGDAAAMARMLTEETAGAPGHVGPDGSFAFA